MNSNSRTNRENDQHQPDDEVTIALENEAGIQTDRVVRATTKTTREDREYYAVKAELKVAINSDDEAFIDGLLEQLVQASRNTDGRLESSRLKFLVSVIRSLTPKDNVEAMAVTQMAAAHVTVMKIFPEFIAAQSLQEFIGLDNSLNKLARTFIAQVASLKRYRDLAAPYVKDPDEGGERRCSKARPSKRRRSKRQPEVADPENAELSDRSNLPEVVSPPSPRGDDDVEQ